MKKEVNNSSDKVKRKESGTCLRYFDGTQVFRSKYKTEQDAQEALSRFLNLGVVKVSDSVYKCPKCKMFHFGNAKFESDGT